MRFCRLVWKDPPGLLDLVVCTARFDGTWGHTVHGDLVLCCKCEKLKGYRNLELSERADRLKGSSPWSRIPRILHMFLLSPFAYFSYLSVAWNLDKIVAPATLHLLCDMCPLKFSSDQSLALHRFKAHGVKNIMRQYVDGTHCPVCLRQFWS